MKLDLNKELDKINRMLDDQREQIKYETKLIYSRPRKKRVYSPRKVTF